MAKIAVPEILNLVLLLVAGILALLAFMAKYNTPESRKWWGYFLVLGFFIFLEKLFETLYTLRSSPAFLNMECLAGMIAGGIAVVVSYLGYRKYVVK